MARALAVAALGLALVGATPASAAPTATVVTLTGAGFGHGVGLSQYGALGQAKEGRTAEQILSYYYTGTTVAPVPDATDIRVNTAHAVPAVQLSAGPAGAVTGGAWRVTVDATPLDLTFADSVSVSGVGPTLVVRVVRAGVPDPDLAGSAVSVEWGGGSGALAALPATVLTANGDQLRHGSLTVVPSTAGGGPHGRLEAVNAVSLHDDYLFGLAEVPSSWPLQALRAQVMAARSYAYRAVLAHPTGIAGCGGCQVYDTDSSQVFRGWKKESEVAGGVDYGAAWRAAVQSTDADPTHGLVPVDATGAPITAYYFSSSGGRTRNSEDVWSASLPYARSVEDHWSQSPDNPNASWTVQVAAAKVAAAFGLPSLASLVVATRDVGGGAATVTAVSGDGVIATLRGEAMRTALGLRSSWLTTVALDLPAAVPPPVPVEPPAPPVVPAVPDPPTLSIVYRQPGPHVLRGRRWTTACTTYAGTLRCVAQPYGTFYVANPKLRGGVLRKAGFQAAATSYTARSSTLWDTNRYAVPGTFADSAGRAWTVNCGAPVGRPRLCVSTVHAKVLTAVRQAGRYRLVRKDYDLVRRYVRLTN